MDVVVFVTVGPRVLASSGSKLPERQDELDLLRQPRAAEGTNLNLFEAVAAGTPAF